MVLKRRNSSEFCKGYEALKKIVPSQVKLARLESSLGKYSGHKLEKELESGSENDFFVENTSWICEDILRYVIRKIQISGETSVSLFVRNFYIRLSYKKNLKIIPWPWKSLKYVKDNSLVKFVCIVGWES